MPIPARVPAHPLTHPEFGDRINRVYDYNDASGRMRANKRPDPFDFGPDEDGVAEGAAELFAMAEKRLDDLAPLDQSAEWHARLLQLAEELLRALEIPYRSSKPRPGTWASANIG